jgi:hypothetical protein
MRAFVDRMLEENKPATPAPRMHTPAKQPRKEAVPPGHYDPSVYRRIRNARDRSKSDGTVSDFDRQLKKVAKDLGRRKAA